MDAARDPLVVASSGVDLVSSSGVSDGGGGGVGGGGGFFVTDFDGWWATAPFGGGNGEEDAAPSGSLVALVALVSSSLRGLLFLWPLSGDESSRSLRFLKKLLILCWE